MSFRPPPPRGRLRAASEAACWTAARLHAGTAWLLGQGARLALRLLRPVPWTARLGVLATLWTGLLLLFWERGGLELLAAVGIAGPHLALLDKVRLLPAYLLFVDLALPLALLLALTAPAAFVRWGGMLKLLRLSALLTSLYALGLLYFLGRIPGVLHTAGANALPKATRNALWLDGFGIWLGLALLAAVFLLAAWLRGPYETYRGTPPSRPLPGDRLLENLKTHGGDPVFRTSLYWAAFLHLFFIVILPLLLLGGWRTMTPYGVPKGSGVQNPGDPVVKMIRVKQPKKQPKRAFVLNPNSPILFQRPDIADSRVLRDMTEAAADTYQATGAETSGKGKLGQGGGTKGGWPNGIEGAKIRFLRLKYDGGDWDQCMGVGADYNFLIQFNRLTGFRIADKTEAIDFTDLRRFPRGRAPPFVYLTGSGRINGGQTELKALRWYCLEEGGMLFADNGGGGFDRSFRALMRQAFPELQFVDIANDDIVYQRPFSFPNGAPPLWHHSGNRALGLKYNGRWICFYHQGDMKDAWKDGHSGASPAVTDQAYKMGVNVVNYAFNQYMSQHHKP